MKVSEFLKKYDSKKHSRQIDTDEVDDDAHSLEHQARVRAAHLEKGLNVGSPFDWEDLEKYKRELERMDREGPGRAKAEPQDDDSGSEK